MENTKDSLSQTQEIEDFLKVGFNRINLILEEEQPLFDVTEIVASVHVQN